MTVSLVIYDTEAATWEDALETGWGGDGQYPEIVQIAAVKVDRRYDTVARFDTLIKPAINPVVSDCFTKLTGINQEQIAANGLSFEEAYRQFFQFCDGAYVICNGWDREAILENLHLYDLEETVPLVNSRNIRPWIMERGIPTESQQSGNLAQHFGLTVQTGLNKHNGVYDSESIRLALKHLAEHGHDIWPYLDSEYEENPTRPCIPLRHLIASFMNRGNRNPE